MEDDRIDWDEAPEWATGWAIVQSGRHLWICEDSYAYVGREYSVYSWAGNPGCITLRHRSELIEIVQKPDKTPEIQAVAVNQELLHALELMISTYPYSPPCHGWEAQVEAHRTAKAAIAKAKGGAA